MNPNEIAQAIGRAFVEVIRQSCEEYVASNGGTRDQMDTALDELSHLAHVRPDYNNPALPFFYVSWYHLNHVRMCYEIFERGQIVPVLDMKNRNTITDLGCGSFATWWGLVYLFSYRQALEEQERAIPGFVIRPFDASKPLLEIGKLMYRNLCKYAREHRQENGAMTALHNAIEAVQLDDPQEDIHNLKQPDGNGVKIVTGIHILYEQDDEFHNSIIEHMEQGKYDFAIFSHDRRIRGNRGQVIERFFDRLQNENWARQASLPLDQVAGLAPPWRDLTESLRDLRQQVAARHEVVGRPGLLRGVPPQQPDQYHMSMFRRETD